MTECILLPEQYNLLWKTSWIPLIPTVFLLYRQQYGRATGGFAIFLTSINYWRRPDYSWRRYLDLATVFFCILYQVIAAWTAQNRIAYYTLGTISFTSFMIGMYQYKQNRWWLSTLLHANTHLLASVAQFMLILGE